MNNKQYLYFSIGMLVFWAYFFVVDKTTLEKGIDVILIIFNVWKIEQLRRMGFDDEV